MLGFIFVCLFFAATLVAGLARPAFGMIGFYAFILLDPAWNWRWSLPQDFAFQKYIFAASLIGFAIHGLRIPRLNKASKWGLISCAAFLLICHTSTWSSIDPVRSERFLSVFDKQIICLFLTVFLLDSPRKIKLFLLAATLAQAYNAYQINLDYFQTGFSRWAYNQWGSYSVDNNGYSLITIPMIGASLAIGVCDTVRWRKYAMLFVSLLQIHQIMLLYSRGAMVGLIPLLAILVWKMPRTKTNIRIIALAAASVFLLAGPSVVEEFSSAFASKENRDSSAESRLLLWKAGYRITMDHPISGVGPDAARILVPQKAYYDGGLETNNKALHNLFFDVSTGTGIPGLVLYMTFILIPIWRAWRSYNPEDTEFAMCDLAVFCGAAGYLTASNFSSGITIESGYILVIAGYASMIVKHRIALLTVSAQASRETYPSQVAQTQ